MKVLFLEIDTESDWAVASLGPAFLAAYLRQHGHEVGCFRARLGVSGEQVADEVARQAPDLIGVSLTTRQWLDARRVLTAIRARHPVPVVVGGLHPTFSPEQVLSHPGIDYVCLGEGEAPLLELVEALAAGRPPGDREIDNIQVKGGPRPRLRPPFEPIDDLPFAARDLLDERYGMVHVSTQRGCPFPCTYCGARMYNELYAGAGSYGRRRSHGNVIRELREIQSRDGLSYVIFLDDTFTIDHRWVDAFCTVYGDELAVPFSLHARVETVRPRMLERLAAAGCRHIVYGVESGSERVRRRIMERSATNRRFVDVFRWTREAGILVTANYILGIPGETREEMQQTLDLHQRLQPDDFGYFVFYPYPGTKLFRVCQEQGYLPEDYLERPANHRETILDLPGVSKRDVAALYETWTQVRTAQGLRRSSLRESDPAAQGVAEGVAACAASG